MHSVKAMFFPLTLAALLTGCTGIERTVKDNIFSSSLSPTVRIRVADGFEYLGHKKKESFGSYRDQTLVDPPRIVNDRYAFRRTENGSPNLVMIEIEEFFPGMIPAFIPPFSSMEMPTALKSGRVERSPDLNYFLLAVDLPAKKDTPPTCLIYKTMGKNVGDHIRFTVDYSEVLPAEEVARHPCRTWQDKKGLDAEQQQYLDDFLKRSQENIVFLDH